MELSNSHLKIPRIQRITQQELIEEYESKSRPIIIEKQVAWKALDLFKPEWFKKNLGHLRFNVVVDMPTNGAPGFHYVDTALKDVPLAKFVDMMHESPSPCYIRQANTGLLPFSWLSIVKWIPIDF